MDKCDDLPPAKRARAEGYCQQVTPCRQHPSCTPAKARACQFQAEADFHCPSITTLLFILEHVEGSDSPFQPADPLNSFIDLNCMANRSTAAGTDVIAGPLENEIVCFGVISGLAASCEGPLSTGALGPLPIRLTSHSSFAGVDAVAFKGTISQLGPLMQELMSNEELQLIPFCTLDPAKPSKTPHKYARSTCKVDVQICGPFGFLDELGSWLEENNVYLQDPRIVAQDIKYCNPHRLSFVGWDTSPMVSQVVSQVSRAVYLRDITDDYNFLDNYFSSSETDIRESEQPLCVITPLKRHQKQALTFMLRREEGWSMRGEHKDIWTIRDFDQHRLFVNTISQLCHQEPPPEFHGGIIADPMGLGKTLTMISLVAMDVQWPSLRIGEDQTNNSRQRSVPTSLIVVPPSLLDTWEEQLQEHTTGLIYRRHHGKTKFMRSEDIEHVHIVLTTFDSVSTEWRSLKDGSTRSVLFSVRWRRIILDEAHIIRNETSQRSKAICALDAQCRWAVTGTPIQNQLNDLVTLLKFIQAFPYHEKHRFEDDITKLLKEEDVKQEGVARLQHLSSCLLLRRPKRTISLPKRHDKECPVEFTTAERERYNELKNRAIMCIDEALDLGADVNKSGVYVNMLQQIEALRLFCDLGVHYHTRHETLPPGLGVSLEMSEWMSKAQQIFNSHLEELGSVTCSHCRSLQSLTDMDNLFDTQDAQQKKPLFSRCLQYLCAECAANLANTVGTFQCGHGLTCPAVPVSTSIYSLEDVPEVAPKPRVMLDSSSSKVTALVTDIQAQRDFEKCIVFSSWRLTLNIVEAGLKKAGIRCCRFDGKVPQGERKRVIDQFKYDPSTRVLLATLACGNVGLNLTEASRAYLMEPHWNPTLEEQAFGRIHRIGQKREVTTVRFFVRNSFEEHVMKVQQSKKELAGIFLSPHDGGQVNSSIERLQELRSLL